MSLYEAVEMYQLAHAGKCPGDLEALAKRQRALANAARVNATAFAC